MTDTNTRTHPRYLTGVPILLGDHVIVSTEYGERDGIVSSLFGLDEICIRYPDSHGFVLAGDLELKVRP